MSEEHFIGLMTGTSMDAVDAVLVRFLDRPGASLGAVTAAVAGQRTLPMPADLRSLLLGVDGSTGIDQVTELDVRLADLFALTVEQLLANAGLPRDRVRAIGSHGQTVFHHPHPPWPRTLQIGDPARLAERSGICTVADFRRRDVAAGGQGAPLAPAFHQALFGEDGRSRLVVNIGGIANLSVLATDAGSTPTGFDTGPGNVLMDGWCLRHRKQPYDRDGQWAASAPVDRPLLQRMLADPYFASPAPKSTGREHFNDHWLDRQLHDHGSVPPDSIQATLCELTATSIADAVRASGPADAELLVCGGGAHNHHMLARLRQCLAPRSVVTTTERGVDPWLVEAIGFAWLARELLAGRLAGPHRATGASRSVLLGAIHPV